MARHDDRNRIVAQRLTDGSRPARPAERSGHVAVGRRRTGTEGTREFIDGAVEFGDIPIVDGHPPQIVDSTGQVRGHRLDDRCDRRRQGMLDGGGKPAPHLVASRFRCGPGSRSPTTPLADQTIAHVPIAVSNSANAVQGVAGLGGARSVTVPV